MAFQKIDNESINSITSALDFFQIPPTNVTVTSSKVFEILPSNPLTDTPYHFKIHSSQNYIDLSKCYLFIELRIRKENENGYLVKLSPTDNVAPIEHIGQTFINNMKIGINGREIYNSNSLYAYKTYLSYELSYSQGAKSSHLNAAGYYFGSDINLESGVGYESRKRLFSNSSTAQFIAKLDADIFNQPLYLINQCEIDIEILPNEAKFVLVAPPVLGIPQTTRYYFEVLNYKLYIKKMDLMDGLALDIARKLDTKPARYAIRKTMMKPLFISMGRYEFNANLFMDQIPRRITLGLVSSSDYVGNLGRSPFNFQHFNVREITIIANGRSYPQALYDLDYENGKYVRAFNDMNEAIGLATSSESNGITYQQYGTTHCVYIFNLTNSGDDQGGLFDLIKNGTTAVNIKFSQPVPEGGIMLVAMGEADSLIILDKNRTIASDTTI
uniref:Major sperm protein n=1 Tax=Meloidogyne incognita TaxID=6306 RepID=A0A914MDR4_MELIC